MPPRPRLFRQLLRPTVNGCHSGVSGLAGVVPGFEGARLQPCRQAAPMQGALAPEGQDQDPSLDAMRSTDIPPLFLPTLLRPGSDKYTERAARNLPSPGCGDRKIRAAILPCLNPIQPWPDERSRL